MLESSGPGYGYPGASGGPGGGGYGSFPAPPPPPPPPPAPRRGGFLSHLGVALLAVAIGVGATLAFDHPATTGNPTASSTTPATAPSSPASPNSPASAPGTVPSPGPSASASAGTGLQAVINKVEPGIVIISSTIQYQSEAGAGTGMVINSDGLVLTNNHVIEDSTKLTATVVATGKTYQAKVLGYDTTGDVALIQLQGASGLTTVPLGNSSSVKTSDSVVALGNAEGQGTILPAAGSITGVNQTITASDQGGTISTETLHGMLETNADIVAGDSGGPLSNSAGQVIGMDTAGQSVSFGSTSSPTGFAIPIDTALAVASQIAAGHASSTISIGYPPFIGIYVAQGTTSSNPQTQAEQQEGSSGNPFGGFGGYVPSCYTSDTDLQVPSQIAPVNSGTLIDGVICGSPAAAAGITGGTVITAVDGKTVGAPNQLQSILATLRPGDTAMITWVNLNGQKTTSTLHLVAGPPL